jgi:hypothetical protein
VISKEAKALGEKTWDAYSAPAYGKRNWAEVAQMLLARGFTAEQAEIIMRSKWTRWARDHAPGNLRYGATPAVVVEQYLDHVGIAALIELFREVGR